MSEVLNCDAKGCGHIESVGLIAEHHVGMPCPKCGENLLTKEDWIAWVPIQDALKLAHDPDLDPQCEMVSIRVGHHQGKTSIEIEKKTN